MAEKQELSDGGQYFAGQSSLSFIPTGCEVLNCALGGGYAENRIINVVGDQSSGKTLLALEAIANFFGKYPEGRAIYAESESAFSEEHAQSLGIPTDSIEMHEGLETVEDWFEHLQSVLGELKDKGTPCLYVLDSLDALSDRAEMERSMDEGTYGAKKAKTLSELFRRLVSDLGNTCVTVLVVSQTRENIGASFGSGKTRSGGKALDFYCSQILWLHQAGPIKVQRKGVERVIGVRVKGKVSKNKAGPPHREAHFNIYFNYGVGDLEASLDFIKQVGRLEELGYQSTTIGNIVKQIDKMDDESFFSEKARIDELARQIWMEIEESFAPTRRKY